MWVRTTKGDLYPNLYTLLVGYAGTGKSITIAAAEQMLRTQEALHLAPTSVTMASMVDELSEAKCTVLRPGKVPPLVEYNSLHLLADEFGALVHKYEAELMNGLQKIYDGGYYAQRRRGKDLYVEIQHPQLNILAGTTPAFLGQFMPEGAWDQGFASRIIMVYSGDRTLTDIFDVTGDDAPAGHQDLIYDLALIYGLYGPMSLSPGAIEAFRTWRSEGEKPVPHHPKLTNYCSRRTAHVLKLCMVASASRGGDMQITLEDFELARGWLLGAELTMPDVFSAATIGGDSAAMEEAWFYVFTNWSKKKKPIQEHELVHFVRERVPAHAVMRVLEIMERDGTLKGSYNMTTGMKQFEPGPRRPTADQIS